MSPKKLVLAVTAFVLTACLTFSSLLPAQTAGAEPRWSNPHMSKEARDVLKYLYNISGKTILTGHHNYMEAPFDYYNKIHDKTGEYPAVWGNDFGWEEVAYERQDVVDAAIEAWRSGSLVTMSWHASRPDAGDNGSWWDVQSWYDYDTMKQLVTPGTELYNMWLEDVDEIAGYLQQLEDAHVPVIWRPYHENNAGFFWWGDRTDLTPLLWRNLYDRLTNYHGLDNLIWNWNTASYNEWSHPVDGFYPGDDYVDMVSVDIYDSFKQSYYEDTLRVANGKPIAIGEAGPLPDIEFLQQNQPLYTYFLGWGNFFDYYTTEGLNNAYHHDFASNQDDMKQSLVVRQMAGE